MSEQWTAPGSDPTRPPDTPIVPVPNGPAPSFPHPPAPPAYTPEQGQSAPPPYPMGPPTPAVGSAPPGWGHLGSDPVPGPPPGPAWGAPPASGWPPPTTPGALGAPSAWRPGFDFRPGIVPLRPLQLGDLYSGLIKAIRGNVAATIGLAALTSALFLVPTTALGALLASMDAGVPFPTGDALGTDPVVTPIGPGMFSSYLPTIGSALSTILLAGFMAYVIGQAVLGRKVTLGETWEGTRPRLLALIGATVIITMAVAALMIVGMGIPIGIGVALGLSDLDVGGGVIALLIVALVVWIITLVVGILYVMTRLSFVTPSIVLEDSGIVASINRSWRLVGGWRRGPFWRIFGIRLLTSVIVSAASSIVMFPLMAIFMVFTLGTMTDGGTTSTLYLGQTIMTGLIGILAGALTTPFSAGLDALLYVDARIRTEGLDLTLMRACDGSGPLPWASAVPR